MQNIIDERKVPLNKILKELYVEKGYDEENPAAPNYKDFVNDNTKKLKEILRAMNVNIDQFKNDNGRYEISIPVAELFKLYLKEESGKNSYISKIKAKKFLDITSEEKVNFINKVIKRIEKRYDEDINKEKVNEELIILRERWLREALYNYEVRSEISEIESTVNLIMEAAMVEVAAIKELDGMVAVDNGIYNETLDEDIEKEIKKAGKDKVPYDLRLKDSDRFELVKYLETFIIDSIRQWKRVVDITCELRADEITHNAINGGEYISSRELIELAIKDYEEEIKAKMEPKVIPEITKEEMKKLIDELKLKSKEKKNIK